MAHKHIKEENFYFNNSSNSSESEDETYGNVFNEKSSKKAALLRSNFIYNDLKGLRKGGPLADNGNKRPTKDCEADGCDSVQQETLYKPKCFQCREKPNHPRLCHRCAFERPQCLTHRVGRVNGWEKYKDTDPKMIAWP